MPYSQIPYPPQYILMKMLSALNNRSATHIQVHLRLDFSMEVNAVTMNPD